MTNETPTRFPAEASDPLARSRRRTRRAFVAMVLAVIAAAAWGLWPVGANRPAPSFNGPQPSGTPAAKSARPMARSSSPAAFSAPLWVDPPKPVIAKVDTPASPAPLRLQLIAILTPPPLTLVEGAPSSLRAILYDQDADKLLTVNVGQVLGARMISAIDPEGVTVSLASGPQRLGLHPELAMASPVAHPGVGHATTSTSSSNHRNTAAEDLAALMGRTLIKADGQPNKPHAQGTSTSPVGPSATLPKSGGGPDR